MKYGIDIIEVSDYGGLGIFLTDDALPPVVLTGHGSLLQYSRYNFTRDDEHAAVIRKLEHASYTYAQAVIAHSPLDQEDLKILFNRNIDLALIPWEWPEHTPLQNTMDKMVVLGGLQPIKGIYELAGALQLLKTECRFMLGD